MSLPACAPNRFDDCPSRTLKELAFAKLRLHATQQSRLDPETLNLPSQTERLNPLRERLKRLRIGGDSLAIGPLCDSRFLALDLHGHYGGWERCTKPAFRDARRRLRQNFRNGCGNDRGLHAGIDIHPRWAHPVRRDSDDRPDGVGTSDCFRFGNEG